MTIKELIKDAGPGMIAAFIIGAISLGVICTGLLVAVNMVFFN